MFVEISWNSKWNFNQYFFNFDEKGEKRGDNSMKYHWNQQLKLQGIFVEIFLLTLKWSMIFTPDQVKLYIT
jgi:hypothetical protein